MNERSSVDLEVLLQRALAARHDLFDARHEAAFRLFNGFYEGDPRLVADLYGRTLLLHNYADPPSDGAAAIETAREFFGSRLPWIACVLLKTRHGSQGDKQGVVIDGGTPDRKIHEHGVWYAIDLTMNRDASLYLDTRHLRRWAIDRLGGTTVLNTFAYTGSLGVAARAAGADRVVHLDLNRQFLNVAKTSYTLNGFPIRRPDFQAGDFWTQINRLKRADERFDCVFVDPPFFAATSKGTVDLLQNYTRVINKVRPLISDGGYLVAINNALFLPGAAYLDLLQSLCADGYLRIENLIPIPPDFTGYDHTRVAAPPTDPAPFNHPTKIAVLRVRRKA